MSEVSELDVLRAEVATLKELLAVHEVSAQDQFQKQRAAIHELSTPILEVWRGVVVLPVVGGMDADRCAQIMESLLTAVVAREARVVILDVTGVSVIDTDNAAFFLKIFRSVSLLGGTGILTGIRPQVAQTLVELGVELTGVVTCRNLHQGLIQCFRILELTAPSPRKTQA